MYNRKRIARSAGAAVAVWALIGLLVMSSGVAYAVPLAGLGGFNIAASSISASNLVMYPGAGDTSTMDRYPMTVAELQNVRIRDLWLYKTINLGRTPGLSGTARVYFVTSGTSRADNILVKSSALATDGHATFHDFAVQEHASSDPRGQFAITSNGPVTLERPRINAHYLTSSSISISNTYLAMCYDPDGDQVYEIGNCPDGDPISQSYDLSNPGRAQDPPTPHNEDQWAFDGPVKDVGQAIQDVADTVTTTVTNVVTGIADAIGSIF